MRRIDTFDSDATYHVSRSDSLMDMTTGEKKKYSNREFRWLNYLTNAWYNGTLDMANLGVTILIVIFNLHLDVGNLDQDHLPSFIIVCCI